MEVRLTRLHADVYKRQIQAGFGKIVFVIRKAFEAQFREKILSKYEGHIPAELCFQALDDLPEGFSVPEGREKP